MIIEMEYKDVGRNNFCGKQKVIIKTDDFAEAIESCEELALKEVKKHLKSSIVDLNFSKKDHGEIFHYTVFVGVIRPVGEVILKRLQ